MVLARYAYLSICRVRSIVDRYGELARKHGWTPGHEHCHLVRNVYVGETNARAREEAEPHLDYFWRKLLSYHRGSMKIMGIEPKQRPSVVQSPEEIHFDDFDFELTQKHGMVFVGDPETVIAEIKAEMTEI